MVESCSDIEFPKFMSLLQWFQISIMAIEIISNLTLFVQQPTLADNKEKIKALYY